MLTVTITRGLPACGKSTWCREQVQHDPRDSVIVNADALRKMFHDAYWFRDRTNRDITENFIRKACVNLAQLAIDEHKNVYIDETNLSDRSYNKWKNFAAQNKAKFEVQDFRDTPLEVCLDRDARREKAVGEKVIRDKYKQFILPLKEEYSTTPFVSISSFTSAANPNLPSAVIFDIDGTIADNNWRSPYDLSRCDEDPVVENVVQLLQNFHSMGYKILLVSGRDEGLAREKTSHWLGKNWLAHLVSGLFMRPAGDTRRDDVIKEELFNKFIRNRYNVAWVVDDRNRTVDKWRELGLTCLQCAPGDF